MKTFVPRVPLWRTVPAAALKTASTPLTVTRRMPLALVLVSEARPLTTILSSVVVKLLTGEVISTEGRVESPVIFELPFITS